MQQLLSALRAAGEETRLRLLAVLAHGELTVSELTQVLGQSQPRVSRHLKLLCDAGLLQRYQEGSWVFYRLKDTGDNADFIQKLVALIDLQGSAFSPDHARLERVKQYNQSLASKYFSLIADEWDQIRDRTVADTKVEALMLTALPKQKNLNLLDLGTGTGRILELFSPHIEWGLGIDLSHEMLTIARVNLDQAEIGNCQVRQGDIRDLPLADKCMDVISIHQVLHYLNDPADVICESARILKSGGRLLVVDFQPHQVEALRTDHAHRRLGFSDQEVNQWCTDNALSLIRSQSLIPSSKISASQLVVSLWILSK